MKTTYPSKQQLFYFWPHSITQPTLEPIFIGELSNKKSQALEYLFEEIKKTHPQKDADGRQEKLFNLIKNFDLRNIDVKISLLVDCIYQVTALGKEFWSDISIFTPTLKRGVLHDIVLHLKMLHVDLVKLPGFGDGAYSSNMIGVETYPSKKVIAGFQPPLVVPLVEVSLRETTQFENDADKSLVDSAQQFTSLL